MSFVSDHEQELILDLVLKRITEENFLAAFPLSKTEAKDAGLHMLARALNEEDADGVEFGLYLGFHFGFSGEYLDVLNNLAKAPWHKRHEDVVSALTKLQSPTSVEPLHQAASAKYAYLDYDEAFALANKAIHGLGKIQTMEAVARLGALLRDEREVVRSYARKELGWIAREGAFEDLRIEAQRLSSG